MKYLKIWGGNGYCGCDFEEVLVVNDDMTEEEANDIAHEAAMDNADTFSYVRFGWDEERSEEEYEEYIENNVEYGYNFMTRAEYLEFCEANGFEPKVEF